jgi:hypothetical protein
MSKKELEVKQASTPAVYDGPTGLADNITAADLHLPRIALLQSMSKNVQDNPDVFKPGSFMNTLTQEPIPAPVIFTPVFIFKNAILWNPREKGGGIVYKTMKFTADVVKDLAWKGTEKPAATAYVNAVCLVEGSDMPLVISFCNTSFKAGQDLLTLVQLSGCAWKYQYELQSVKTSNAKGTWYVMRVKRLSLTDEAKTAAAAHMYENVKGMAIDTDYEGATEATSTEVTGAEPQEF